MDNDAGCFVMVLVFFMAVIFCAIFSNVCYDSGVVDERIRIQADAVRKGIGKYRVSDKETGQAEFVWLVPVEEGPTVETLPGK